MKSRGFILLEVMAGLVVVLVVSMGLSQLWGAYRLYHQSLQTGRHSLQNAKNQLESILSGDAVSVEGVPFAPGLRFYEVPVSLSSSLYMIWYDETE